MRPERWQEIRRAFEATLEAEPHRQELVLAVACGDDEALRSDVENLLAADAQDLGLLPAASGGLRSLGPYELQHRLGSGGTSDVFLAVRQDDPAHRRVAVKVMRGLPGDQELTRRFLQERQILGGLDHPNIAGLLDGGATKDGVHYVVLEYVEGLPMDRYCRCQGLSVEERLLLFLQVCAGVQHAHQNLVVHRDLKPGNVLVTAVGQVKLLDFGIAKLLNAELTGQKLAATLPFSRRLTLSYASPEQVGGELVTTASDVYSLGVMLFELLAGAPPYDLEGRDRRQAERLICEVQPSPPSVVARFADGGGSAQERLSRRLRGDLDTILLKALRKEPGRRYGSAAELEEDLRRHLEHRPVRAVGDTWTYRTAKLVRRNPLAAALLLAVVAFGIVMTALAQQTSWALEETRRMERKAAGERAKAERVSSFLLDLFSLADPREARSSSVSAKELLDRGARRAKAGLERDPEVRAALLDTLGRVYRNLGSYDQAAAPLEEALVLRRTLHGDEHPDVATSISHLAELRYAQGEFEVALDLSRQALERRQAGPDARPEELAISQHQVAEMLHALGRLDEAEDLYRKAQALRTKTFGRHHTSVVETLSDLGYLLFDQGHYEEARDLLQESLALGEEVFAGPHPVTAHALSYLAAVEHAMGFRDKAERDARASLDLLRELYGAEHPEVASVLGDLGMMLVDQGRPEEAEKVLRQSLELQERALGVGHPSVATQLNNLALALRSQDRLDEAEPLYRRALEIGRLQLGSDHAAVATMRENLADILRLRGRLEEALDEYQEANAIRERVLPEDHPDRAFGLLRMGLVHVLLNTPAAGEPFLRRAVEILERALGPGDWRIALAESTLGGCLLGMGDLAEASALLAATAPTLEAKNGLESTSTQRAVRWLAEVLEAQGKAEEARGWRIKLTQTPPRRG